MTDSRIPSSACVVKPRVCAGDGSASGRRNLTVSLGQLTGQAQIPSSYVFFEAGSIEKPDVSKQHPARA